jgi:alpha-D-ribose 1-methylphosphonate 5-triphosphate diphosphatase PhnM
LEFCLISNGFPTDFQPVSNGFPTSFQHNSLNTLQMSLSKRVVKSMRVEEAMQELNEASEIVQLREAVKPHESKRISEAFQSLSKPGLLSRSELQPGSRTADRHESYRKFLDKVQKTSGDQMVALCAIGLGQSTIAGMKDAVRVRLPARIQEKRAQLESDALKRITDAHLAKRQIQFCLICCTLTFGSVS